jgi:hypothetical protein
VKEHFEMSENEITNLISENKRLTKEIAQIIAWLKWTNFMALPDIGPKIAQAIESGQHWKKIEPVLKGKRPQPGFE